MKLKVGERYLFNNGSVGRCLATDFKHPTYPNLMATYEPISGTEIVKLLDENLTVASERNVRVVKKISDITYKDLTNIGKTKNDGTANNDSG